MKQYLTICILTMLCSCSLALKIKNGDMAYQLKHYALAAELYSQEYMQAQSPQLKATLAQKAGKSYANINDFSRAFEWYSLSYSDDKNNEALLQLGKTALAADSIGLAKRIFKKLYSTTSDQNYLTQVGYIEKLNYSKSDYEIIVEPYSSVASDYSPVKFEQGYILFASDRETDQPAYTDTYTGRLSADLYLANIRSNNAFGFDAVINTEKAEGSACFNTTYSEIYFTRCSEIQERDIHCRIYQSKRILGEWREAEPILFFSEDVNVGHPAYMAADSTLFFSARDGSNHDIYFSRKMENGWTLPEPISTIINSPYNEKFPVVDKDTLYFSSDRFPGYGQLDIYKTYIGNDGYWTKPQLLDPPYNSGADDFGYLALTNTPNGRILNEVLLTSNRQGGKGLDDIWSIQKLASEADIVDVSTDKTYKVYTAFKVIDRDTKQPLSAFLTLSKNGELVLTNSTDKDGRLIRELGLEGELILSGEASGYFVKQRLIRLPNANTLKADTTINVTLSLEPIQLGKEIVLDNIYYDFDKWDIRNDAKPALDTLALLLMQNPSIRIELASHTDCQGEQDYNMELSTKRAQSAREYLINVKAISPNRIQFKGYGESQPAIDCKCESCSDQENQINRRTSFKVVKLD